MYSHHKAKKRSFQDVCRLNMPQFAAFEDGVKHALRIPDGPHCTGGLGPRGEGVTRAVTHVTTRCQVDAEGDVSARCQAGTCSIMHQALALAGAPL